MIAYLAILLGLSQVPCIHTLVSHLFIKFNNVVHASVKEESKGAIYDNKTRHGNK